MKLTLQKALETGIEAQRSGDFNKADQIYTAIIKSHPQHPNANYNMAILASSIGKFKEAVPFFLTAIEGSPDTEEFWTSYIDALLKFGEVEIGSAMFEKAVHLFGRNKKLKQIEHILIQIRKKSPLHQEDNNLYVDQITELFKIGQFDEIINYSFKLLLINPHDFRLLYFIGRAYLATDQNEYAIRAFRYCLLIKPDNLEALINLAALYKDRNEIDKAIKVYLKVLEHSPNQANVYYNMGVIFDEVSDYDNAVDCYKKATSMQPDFAKAYNNLGSTLMKLGRIDEAALYFSTALSIQTDFPEVHFNLGLIKAEQGRYLDAIKFYLSAIELDTKFVSAYFNLGNTYQEIGLLQEAIENYHKALKLAPHSCDTYNNLGVCYQEKGEIQFAIDAYERALSINPENSITYWNLSGTTKNIEEAEQFIVKCLNTDPNNIRAKFTLSAIQYYNGSNTAIQKLLNSEFKDHPIIRSIEWVIKLPHRPRLFFNRWALFDQMVAISDRSRPFYEFGVWRGVSFKYLMKSFKSGYGFDTFEGLPENWHTTSKGTYSSYGNVPKVKGGSFIVGEFEKSLPGFFASKRPKASIINFDADLYSSTLCALKNSKSIIDHKTILIFDEFLINNNWEDDEHRALVDFCELNQCSFEVLGVSFFSKQVAVRLTPKA